MRVEIGFGTGFDRANDPLDPLFVAKAIKQILIEASRMFGGCNLTRGQGAWINPEGTLVLEESATLVVDIPPAGSLWETRRHVLASAQAAVDKVDLDTRLVYLANFIRTELSQEAVHVTVLDGSSSLVTAGV